MAIVKFTAIVDEIRGSIGGTTFQRNAYGWSIKRKPNIIRPNTLRQQVKKDSFSSITRYWKTLTPVQRTSWDTYATNHPLTSIKNPSVNITGFSYFIKYHLIRFTASSQVFLPSAGVFYPDYTFTSFVLKADDLGQFRLIYNYNSNVTVVNSVFYLSPPLNESRIVPRLTPLFISSFFQSSSIGNARTVDESIAAPYFSEYATIPLINSWISVRITIYSVFDGSLFFVAQFRVQVVAI
jgi:hypothetical protein